MNSNYKIGIVENEEIFRSLITSELTDSGEIFIWKSAEECFRDDSLSLIDILLVDIGLPHMSGIDLIKIVKNKYPYLKILVISGISSDEAIFQALQFGANGYIWKKEINDLKRSVNEILQDGSVMSPSIGIRILHFFRARLSPVENELSAREKQVLELIIAGLKTNKIGDKLGISEGSIRKHINNIYAKLQVTNRVELMRKAADMGYL